MKLLAIEDQASVRVLVASLLRDAGHEVQEASTVAEAMAALDAGMPDAVLLDLSLDAPSAALHSRLRSALLPVLVISGLEEEDAQAAATANGWQLLHKPFDPERLLAMASRLTHPPPPPPRSSREDGLPPPPVAPAASPTERPPLEGLSALPSSHDPWRDRIRVVLDRVIYLVALVSVVVLARQHALDVQTVAAILLVAGVRPHNLFELASATRGGRASAAVLLAPALDSLRHGTWLAR